MTNALFPSDLTERLVREVGNLVTQYVFLTGDQCLAICLWVLHTHAVEAAETTPYLHITSAEKRSGKTRLLEVLEGLVHNPLMTVNISDAALFRMLAQRPTLLLDEVDAIFAPGSKQEDKRALLNAGYRRSGRAYRCDPTSLEPRSFDVYGPKALAGIGGLPDTVADRSIPILLQRKRAGEEARPLRQRDFDPAASTLRAELAAWGALVTPTLKASYPAPLPGLDDRAMDGWEPLLAVAELAGPDLAEISRECAVTLSGPERHRAPSPGIELLTAIRDVFDQLEAQALHTEQLIYYLAQQTEQAYESWWDARENRPMPGAARRLAQALRPYEIRSRDIRIGAEIRKGYRRDDFRSTWARLVAAGPRPADQADSATQV